MSEAVIEKPDSLPSTDINNINSITTNNGNNTLVNGHNTSSSNNPVSLPFIVKNAKSCQKLLLSLQELTNDHLSNDEFYCDCTRLVERCLIFLPFIVRVLDSEHTTAQSAVINLLLIPKKYNELQFLLETLELIKAFIANHRDRSTFRGITEINSRNLYNNDIAKLNHRLMRLSEGFNLVEGQKDSNFIQRRKEDLKVS
jgi:hypothetical protein